MDIELFLRSIPAAASSPYAFGAYAIAALVFLFAGARLRMAKLLLAKITSIPEAERRRALEIATGTVLPTHISPEQWIRLSRLRWTFLLLGSLLIVILAIATIAIVNPAKTALEGIKTATDENARRTQEVVLEGNRATAEQIDNSTAQIVTTVQDAALASLETMFPLAVRIERTVDETIMHLDGSARQRLISYDKNLVPMKLHWGDRFHYFAYREQGGTLDPSTGVFLEVKSRTSAQRLPLRLDTYSEQELRIPGSSSEPMDAYFVNETGISGVSIKITIYSADRERGREEFRKALMNTSLNSAARRVYLEVTDNGVRLRSEPSANGAVLRSLLQGTYAKVSTRSDDGEWSQIRLPEGREGWIKSEFLKQIAP